MSVADRLLKLDGHDWQLIIDARARARRGSVEAVRLLPTKMRLPDAELVDWLLTNHAAPSVMVSTRGTVWLLADPGDGTVWFAGHSKPTKIQRVALAAVLEAFAQEFPDTDVPLVEDDHDE